MRRGCICVVGDLCSAAFDAEDVLLRFAAVAEDRDASQRDFHVVR